jgi:magnesium-transporting ATPase (P-type)
MSMGMLFELIADIRRWNSDKKVNNYPVQMVYDQGGKLHYQKSTAQKLSVGDIIQMCNGCMVPADCIVLSTNDPLGQCYISTSNLDGERNLKPKLAPKLT